MRSVGKRKRENRPASGGVKLGGGLRGCAHPLDEVGHLRALPPHEAAVELSFAEALRRYEGLGFRLLVLENVPHVVARRSIGPPRHAARRQVVIHEEGAAGLEFGRLIVEAAEGLKAAIHSVAGTPFGR